MMNFTGNEQRNGSIDWKCILSAGKNGKNKVKSAIKVKFQRFIKKKGGEP